MNNATGSLHSDGGERVHRGKKAMGTINNTARRNETLTLVVFCMQMRMHLGRHSSPVKIVRLQPLPHQVLSTVSDETFRSRSYLQGRSPLLVTAKKFANSAAPRPTLRSFPDFFWVAAKEALLRSRPSPNPDTVAQHVYGTRDNMGEERCCSAISHQI
jgi:hypothetical protein